MMPDDRQAALIRRLEAMGITTYVSRAPHAPGSSHGDNNSESVAQPQAGQSERDMSSASPSETSAPAAPTAPPISSAESSEPSKQASPQKTPPKTMQNKETYPTPEWKRLATTVKNCKKCVLHEGRTKTVFGVGDYDADWLFIGEGPGADEDRQGEPFVGRAGKLLDRMIGALGLTRQQVYIANVVKCRPPDNRNPRPEEIVACMDYLRQQIRMIRPKLIVCLGGVSAQAVLNVENTVGKLRGYAHSYEDEDITVPLIVTYHPAYLLRSPTQKKAAWEDLQLASETIGHKIPERS